MWNIRRRSLRRAGALLVVVIIAGAFIANGCTSMRTITNRNPTGQRLPAVSGQSLEKTDVALPGDFAGAPAVLLVGYAQGAQFDIDRWLMGLLQAEIDVRLVEVATIPGLVPTMISGWIDDGMRAGIPREDWASVVTLYGKSAAPIARLTGTEFPRRARVLVLDQEGTIAWFDDTGYAARKALEVGRVVTGLRGGAGGSATGDR
jgi:hypothetical protein